MKLDQYLQGFYLKLKIKNLNLVALDGYRLALRSELLDSDNNIKVVFQEKH